MVAVAVTDRYDVHINKLSYTMEQSRSDRERWESGGNISERSHGRRIGECWGRASRKRFHKSRRYEMVHIRARRHKREYATDARLER